MICYNRLNGPWISAWIASDAVVPAWIASDAVVPAWIASDAVVPVWTVDIGLDS